MIAKRLVGLILCSLLGLASAGCWQVAAAVAGGALTQWGIQTLRDTSEQSVDLPLPDVERAAHAALTKMDVCLVDVTHHRTEQAVTRVDLEGCLVGADVLPVDVRLDHLTSTMTRIRVTARRSSFEPEPELAEEILAHIVDAARRARIARARAPQPHHARTTGAPQCRVIQ